MLNIEDIEYPISFVSNKVGVATFTGPYSTGTWDNGEPILAELAYFIRKHNERFKLYGDYRYIMSEQLPDAPKNTLYFNWCNKHQIELNHTNGYLYLSQYAMGTGNRISSHLSVETALDMAADLRRMALAVQKEQDDATI